MQLFFIKICVEFQQHVSKVIKVIHVREMVSQTGHTR